MEEHLDQECSREHACVLMDMQVTEANDDGCVHCGCGCGGEGEYRTGNRVNAVATFRSSTL